MKLEIQDSLTFLVDGRPHLRGDYAIETRGSAYKLKHKYNSTYISNQFVGWEQWTDSSDAAYASHAAFKAALPAIIQATDVVATVATDYAAITQLTSKTTTVESNTLSTLITTVSVSDAADAAFSFTFTNSKITATSLVLPTVNMVAGNGKALVTVVPGAGSAVVTVTNVGTASFSAAIKIGLVVIPSA